MCRNCHLSVRVEPLVFVIGVWPSIRYKLHIAVPDSSNHVRGLDDLFLQALTCKVGIMCGCLGSRTFFVVERHLEFLRIFHVDQAFVSVRDA